MAASRGHDAPSLTNREDISTWEEGRKAVRLDQQGRHDLRVKVVRDWTITLGIVIGLAVSLGGLVGLMDWPDGPITPDRVLLSIVFGWVGTQLQSSNR